MEGYFKNPYFKRTYALSVGFKMKPLWVSLGQIADILQLSLNDFKTQGFLFDFNATFSNWHEHNKATYKGLKIDATNDSFTIWSTTIT